MHITSHEPAETSATAWLGPSNLGFCSGSITRKRMYPSKTSASKQLIAARDAAFTIEGEGIEVWCCPLPLLEEKQRPRPRLEKDRRKRTNVECTTVACRKRV